MSNPKPNEKDTSNEQNPFVAFRRFSDNQVFAAFHALTDLPTTFATLRDRLEEAESDAHKAWERFNDSYERATNPERRQIDGMSDAGDRKRTEGRKEEEEDYWGMTMRRSHEKDRERKKSHHNVRRGQSFQEPWPMMGAAFEEVPLRQRFWRPSLHFLLQSGYSPLRLEQQYPTEGLGNNWRRAFEDLLTADRGEELSAREQDIEMCQGEKAADWVGGLAGRGHIRSGPFGAMMPHMSELLFGRLENIFGPLPFQDFHNTAFPSHDLSATAYGVPEGCGKVSCEPDTELDLYEHFLGQRSSSPPFSSSDTSKVTSEGSSVSQQDSDTSTRNGNISIIATLTTTESRSLPDGTTTTKTVLKRRFADGTEESEESTTTTHGNYRKEKGTVKEPLIYSKSHVPIVESEGASAVHNLNADSRERGQKKDWFWSSW